MPTTDIPNLPKADLSMPVAKYPDIPTIRHQEMSLGGQDWGRRAGQLQQENLPSSFEHGAKRIAAAAGSGQEYMAKAISKGFSAVGATLMKLQNDAIESADSTAAYRADYNRQVLEDKFNAETATMTPQEKQKHFEENTLPELQKNGSSAYGASSRLTIDKIHAQDSAWGARMGYKLRADSAIESKKNDISFVEDRYTAAKDAHDTDRMADLAAQHFILTKDKGALELRNQEINRVHREDATSVALEVSPEALEENAKLVVDGKEPAPEFDYLKGDKAYAVQALNTATRARTQKQISATEGLERDVKAGLVPVDKIDEEAKTRGVPEANKEILKRETLKANPPVDPARTSKLMTRLNNYDPLAIPGETSNMSEHTAISSEISMLPESQRETFKKKLKDKWDRAENGGRPSVTDKQIGRTMSYIDTLVDRQYFGTYDEMGLDSNGKIPKRPNDAATKKATAFHSKIEAVKTEIEEMVSEHSDWTPTKIDEEAMKIAQKAAGKTSLPAPPPTEEGKTETVDGKPTAQQILQERERRRVVPKGTTAPIAQPGPSEQVGAGYVIPSSLAPEGGLTATQMPPGKLLPSVGFSSEGIPMAEPVHGYTPAPTPSAPRIAPPETAAAAPQPSETIKKATTAPVSLQRPTGTGWTPDKYANVRNNNPGAMYPGGSARKFGMTGVQSLLGGKYKIATFPSSVHGAAANMDNLATKYVGLTVSAAMKKWSGGLRSVPGAPGGKDWPAGMVITREMTQNPDFMIPFMKAITTGEAPGRYPMTDDQWQTAFNWYRKGEPEVA